MKEKIILKILPALLTIYLKTVKVKIISENKNKKKAIFIFWHNKMLLGWWLFKERGYSALVSQSKDGELLSRVLNRWKYDVIRGSSSKGGKEAIEVMIEKVNSGKSAVITPDGPRGPLYEIKNGALIISNKTGLPVIPVKIKYKKKKVLFKSWDNFEIPLPFSRCEIVFGDEFYYKEYLNEPELNNFKENLAKQL